MEFFRLVLRSQNLRSVILSTSRHRTLNTASTANNRKLKDLVTKSEDNTNVPKASLIQKPEFKRTPPATNTRLTGSNVAAALLNKQRPKSSKKKAQSPPPIQTTLPSFKIKAYATADCYDLDMVRDVLLKSDAYIKVDNSEIPDECLCMTAKYQEINEIEPRHLFFFENGCVVFWNLSKAEQNSILLMVQKSAQNPYPDEFVDTESESIDYFRLSAAKNQAHNNSETLINSSHFSRMKRSACFIQNSIYFLDSDNVADNKTTSLLEKYAFSDAIASSVKLGIWEKNLDEFTSRIEFISSDLKQGAMLKLKSEEVLQFLGELFTMRHVINLHSNFLGTPDFYWDREELGAMYEELGAYLSITKRTKLFNERLNHCIDLMQILKQHLSDNKHTRLEWIIIGLITIEVLIGLGIFDAFKSGSFIVFEFFKNKF